MQNSYTHNKKCGTFMTPQYQFIGVTLTPHVPLRLFDMFSTSHMPHIHMINM